MGMTGIVLGLVLAGQAGPPDEVFRCAREVTTPAERVAIADAMIADASPPVLDEVGLRLRDCAIRAGHGAETGRPLAAAAFGLLAAEEIRGRLATVGLDMALVDRWFAEQEESTRTIPPDDEAGERIVRSLIARGVAVDPLLENATLLGNYLGAMIMVERARLGLPFE